MLFHLFPTSYKFEGFSFLVTISWMHPGLIDLIYEGTPDVVWPVAERTITLFYECSPSTLRIFLEVVAQWWLTWNALCLKPLRLFSHGLWIVFWWGSEYFYKWVILLTYLKCSPIALSLACLLYIRKLFISSPLNTIQFNKSMMWRF